MKKLRLVLVSIGVIIAFTACDKEGKGKEKEENNKEENNTPKETEVTFTYTVTAEGLSPIFNSTISYKNENNEVVTLENESLPWKKTITVKPPFEALVEGQYALIPDVEIPDIVKVGHNVSITQYNGFAFESIKTSLDIPKANLEAWLTKSGHSSLTYLFEN